MIGAGAVGIGGNVAQLPVGGHDEGLGHGDVERHRVGLVRQVVLDGPPEVGAEYLAAHRDPRVAAGCLRPQEATEPARWNGPRPSFVGHLDCEPLAGLSRDRGKGDPDPPTAALELERPLSPEPDQLRRADRERRVQVQHQPFHRVDDIGMDGEGAANTAVRGPHADREIVERDVVAGLLTEERAAGGIRRMLREQCTGQAGEQDEGREGGARQYRGSHGPSHCGGRRFGVSRRTYRAAAFRQRLTAADHRVLLVEIRSRCPGRDLRAGAGYHPQRRNDAVPPGPVSNTSREH